MCSRIIAILCARTLSTAIPDLISAALRRRGESMLIVSYDISDTKLRTKFSQFLSQYGYRLQLSVFKIKNSDRMLDIILSSIEADFASKFSESDSVIVFRLSKQCKQFTYGYAGHMDDDLIFI